jgi:hypothetical protein
LFAGDAAEAEDGGGEHAPTCQRSMSGRPRVTVQDQTAPAFAEIMHS